MKRIKIIILMIGLVMFSSCTEKKSKKLVTNKIIHTVKPINIAHRGGSKLAPENTIAAFKNAIKIGVDMIEIDVHLSKDGEIIVIHDGSVDKTTNGKGEIKDLTLAEIKKLDAGSWFSDKYVNEKVSTLSEVLQAIDGKAKLLIEIKDGDEKYPGLEKKIVEAIKEQNALNWVVVQSFNKNSILRIKKIYPELITFYLLGNNFDDFYNNLTKQLNSNESIDKRFKGIAPHHSRLDADKVKLLHSAGYEVYTFTVNSKEDLQKTIDYGVDGIITDIPDVLKDILK